MRYPPDPRESPWYFGPLVCRCGALLGESVPVRQGAGYVPLTKMAPGLVRLPPEPGTGRARFGVRNGARRSPERALLRREPLAPARPPSADPRYKRRQRAMGGRGSEADPEIGPHASTQAWDTNPLIYCPGCGRANRIDLARRVGAKGATMLSGN